MDFGYFRCGDELMFPLYIYPEASVRQNNGLVGQILNLTPETINHFAALLNLKFNPDLCPQCGVTLSPPTPQGGVTLTAGPFPCDEAASMQSNPTRRFFSIINNIPIKRNFVENLPYNPSLKQLAREKRKAGILSEVLFWQQVHKGMFHHIDFDRQRIIGNYIVDFYVKTLGLVIEIDGSSHDNKVEYDLKRQQYLESYGLRVYRIPDHAVKKFLGQVMADLERYIVEEYGEKTTLAWGQTSGGGEATPAFGQTSGGWEATPAFGHPSGGGEATPAFGQTSGGGEATPAFGQTSGGGEATPAFGHPFGGGEATPAFGHPSKGGEFGEFGMGDLLDYVCAVVHSKGYCKKNQELLKIDFLKIPHPSNQEAFWELVVLGGEIRQLQLLENPIVNQFITTYPVSGNNEVCRNMTAESPGFELTNKANQTGKVWINNEQYFEGVPLQAWNFCMQGCQPAQKWLKNRKGLVLSDDEIIHYQKIIVALTETEKLLKVIDAVIFK